MELDDNKKSGHACTFIRTIVEQSREGEKAARSMILQSRSVSPARWTIARNGEYARYSEILIQKLESLTPPLCVLCPAFLCL
jgi:hypothetical protein